MAFYPAQEIIGLHPHQATKVLNKCHVCSVGEGVVLLPISLVKDLGALGNLESKGGK